MLSELLRLRHSVRRSQGVAMSRAWTHCVVRPEPRNNDRRHHLQRSNSTKVALTMLKNGVKSKTLQESLRIPNSIFFDRVNKASEAVTMTAAGDGAMACPFSRTWSCQVMCLDWSLFWLQLRSCAGFPGVGNEITGGRSVGTESCGQVKPTSKSGQTHTELIKCTTLNSIFSGLIWAILTSWMCFGFLSSRSFEWVCRMNTYVTGAV